MRPFGSRLRLKILAICILLGTVPLIVVGVFSNANAARLLQAKVNESNAWALRQAQLTIETQLVDADHALMQFCNSVSVQSAENVQRSGVQFVAFDNITREMSSLPSLVLSGNDVVLVNTRQDWAVGSDGAVYALNDLLSEDDTFNASGSMGTAASVWLDQRQLKSGQAFDASTDGVVLMRRSLGSLPFVAYARIPYESLVELVSNNSRAGTIMVLSADGTVIEGKDPAAWGRDDSACELFKLLKRHSEETGNFTLDDKSGPVSVNYIRSNYNGWYYLSVTPVREITRDVQVIGLFTLFTCLAVMLCIFLASFFLSGRFYRPLHKIYSMISGRPHKERPALQTDELKAIEENVGTMVQAQTRLESQVYKQMDQLREYFTTRLLLEDLDEQFIAGKVAFFEYPKKASRMVLLALRIDSLEGSPYGEDEHDLLLYALKNIVGEVLQAHIVFPPSVHRGYQFTVLAVDDDYKNAVYEAAREAQQTIRQVIGISTSAGVSQVVSGYGELHIAYRQSMEALRNGAVLGGSFVLFYDDVAQDQQMKSAYPDALEHEILDAVRACDRPRCKGAVSRFAEQIFSTEANRREYRLFLSRLLLGLTILYRENGGAQNVDFLAQMDEKRNWAEIERWLENDVMGRVIDQVKTANGGHFKSICDATLEIIHKEYDTKLTLESVAERLSYHPSYIRRVLKSELGVSFSGYLLQYRLNIAKKLLLESDIRISDLAQKLCYENTENFIRSFKRHSGMTPGQFRERNG